MSQEKRAYGYCRVSTKNQANCGFSLDAQAAVIKSTALKQSLYLEEIFVEEGVSASIPLLARKQGAKLLEKLRPGDMVIVVDADRLHRDKIDAALTRKEFKAKNISTFVINQGGIAAETPEQELIASIIDSVNEYRLSEIAKKIKQTKQYQRSRNEYLGGRVPLGCRVIQGADSKRYLQDDTDFHKIIKFFCDREFSARAISNEFAMQGRRICHKALSKFIKKNGYRRDGRGGDRARAA